MDHHIDLARIHRQHPFHSPVHMDSVLLVMELLSVAGNNAVAALLAVVCMTDTGDRTFNRQLNLSYKIQQRLWPGKLNEFERIISIDFNYKN